MPVIDVSRSTLSADEELQEAPEPEAMPEPPAEAAPPPASAFRYDEQFYAPVSPDAPTGSAIEFYHFAETIDKELAWDRNEFGRPISREEAKPTDDNPKGKNYPNFRAARDAALSFLAGTKEIKATRDVRPMLALAIAEAGDAGPVGLAKALDLFVETATTHWTALHPQMEDEDDEELMTRMEEMRKYTNPAVFSLAVESAPITRSPRVGDLTTRSFGIAATKVTPRAGEFAPNGDALTALLAQEDEARERVTEAHEAYRHAIERLRALESFLEERPQVDPVDLGAVAEALEKQAAFIAPFVGSSGAAPSDAAVEDDGGDALDSAPMVAPSTPIAGANTLPEAMTLIDEILGFYARNGRSSPVPLGLIALRDLMAGDFNAWINQTASTGLAEASINLSLVDAARLSEFSSGEAVAAAAPAQPVELDFTDVDSAIAAADAAFTALSTAVYEHQLTLPPQEDGERNQLLAPEVQALQDAIAAINTARWTIPERTDAATKNDENPDNASEGDVRHSRINDRNGVKQSLDAVAAYFEREEPSSPAPAYLRRLKSLVDARFADIARELMPEEGGEAKLRLEPKTNLR